MRGLQKSKRVSWASDLNLCQVKLFLSDESPSQVGSGGQDHLQAKASWHSVGAGSDDNLPPGFEGVQPANLFQNKLSQVPLIQWKCPSRFDLDPNWQVAAGEESKELEVESQREMRVLEAVYPRPSAIPPNPAPALGGDEPYFDDQQTPLIPITPIEDEDMAPDTSLQTPATMSNGIPLPGIEPDVVSAAYSALTAQGNLIDSNLLIKLLSNPTLIEKLVSTHGPALSQTVSNPMSGAISISEPPPATTHLPFSTVSSSSSSSHYPPATRMGGVHVPVSNLPLPPPPPPPLPEVNPSSSSVGAKKDINYYKSLIQQHGGDAVSNPKTRDRDSRDRDSVRDRDTKGKIMKACIYYNSTRGCRHGANCVYQHDSSSQQRASSLPEVQSAKRTKMDREISGT